MVCCCPMISPTVSLLLILALIPATFSYLEFNLVRIPHRTKVFNHQPVDCKGKAQMTEAADADYKELCFQKDISYAIQFFHQGHSDFLAADFTTPISWLKGRKCSILNTRNKCNRIETNFRDILQSLSERTKKTPPSVDKNKAVIEGSSETIIGILEKGIDMEFTVRNSNRLQRFTQVLLLGLYILGETDNLTLKSTNYISASLISKNMNYLCDGAISLRLDPSSETSFLNEMFAMAEATDKVVGVYLGANHTLSVGGLAIKYSQNGYSGITWSKAETDQNFGKLAVCKGILIQSGAKKIHQINIQASLVLTLSASYIGFPTTEFSEIAQNLGKHVQCQVTNSTIFLSCKLPPKLKLEKFLETELIFKLGQSSIAISLASLVMEHSNSKVTFLIRQLQDDGFIVLGEPIFEKYFVAFDYSRDEIGFALRRTSFQSEFFIKTTTLLHFVTMVFLFGCLTICCYQPIRKISTAFIHKKVSHGGDTSETRRLRSYAPVQENPYDQIKDRIQTALQSEPQGI